MSSLEDQNNKRALKLEVDPDFGMSNVKVYRDYSCQLNLTDVAYSVHGHNKFYSLQLLERADGRKWFCFFKWGRVGAKKATSNVFEFYNSLDARNYFEEKFYEKTYNRWEDRALFETKPGKYTLVEIEGDAAEVAK